jgi:thiosulfate reductase cytochrome b subunit
MSAGTLRRAQRRAHLLAAAMLLAYVYAPLHSELEAAIRFGVFPLLALTGIAMWRAARIRRAFRAVLATRAP